MPIGFGPYLPPPGTSGNAPGLLPVTQVLLGLANNPRDDPTAIAGIATGDSPTFNQWTDISPYVLKFDTARGRQHELNRFDAGTGMVDVWNLDGRFNPWNTASPYSPYLQLMRPAQIRMTWNQMHVRDSVPVNGTPTWFGMTNCTVGSTLTATANANGAMTVGQAYTGGSIVPVTPGLVCSALITVFSVTTARTATLTLQWLNGVTPLGTTVSTSLADTAGGVQLQVPLGIAPATATGVALQVTWAACTAGEQHSFAYAQIVYQPAITVFCAPGPLAAQPGAAIEATNAWPVLTGHIKSVPIHWPDEIKSVAQIELVDAFGLFNLSTPVTKGYAAQIAADGATVYYQMDDTTGSTTIAPTVNPGTGLLGVSGVVIPGDQNAVFSLPGAVLTTGGTAIDFGPVNNSLRAPYVDCTRAGFSGGSFSFECWFKTKGGAPVGGPSNFAVTIAAQNVAGPNGWYCGVTAFGSVQFILISGIGATQAVQCAGVADNLWHHMAVTYDGFTLAMYVDGAVRQSAVITGVALAVTAKTYLASFGPGLSTGNVTLDEVAFYNGTTLTLAPVNLHYRLGVYLGQQQSGAYIGAILDNVGWAAAARQLDAGSSTITANTRDLSTTPALSEMQLVETTEVGALFMTTGGTARWIARLALIQAPYTTVQVGFGDFGGVYVPFEPNPEVVYDELDVWNIGSVQRLNGILQTATNTASVTSYGPRVMARTGLLQTNDLECLAQAQWIAARFAQPVTRVRRITVKPMVGADGNGHRAILQRELMDCVRVRKNVQQGGGTGFVSTGSLERIQHHVDMMTGEWSVDLAVAPADPNSYWVLGVSQLDVNARLAY